MRRNLITLGLLLLPLSAMANIVVDKTGVDEKDYVYDLHQCTEMATQVEQKKTEGSAIGTAAKGAAIGSAGKAIAGGSGTDGAKKGAAIGLGVGVLSNSRERRNNKDAHATEQQTVIKNCMTNRGYVVLN
ncbi:glycine zipper family protein [Shewanella sp. Isolate13]|uniref:glycine zipper family protein n=1 Tax=Shewanella sp. Isolate13 TaxID=2908531 RepID=UPI001EFEC73C|nr:glycine zipper family protein [Shewanella sp. Isolate13]MCG9731016.1 glycine zipper family protein [Shewanella sp. Isolate13]